MGDGHWWWSSGSGSRAGCWTVKGGRVLGAELEGAPELLTEGRGGRLANSRAIVSRFTAFEERDYGRLSDGWDDSACLLEKVKRWLRYLMPEMPRCLRWGMVRSSRLAARELPLELGNTSSCIWH